MKLIEKVLDRKNRLLNMADIVPECSNLDSFVKRLCEALDVHMPRDTRLNFIASCEDRSWDMSVCVFLDRMVETARINNIIHNEAWSFGKNI